MKRRTTQFLLMVAGLVPALAIAAPPYDPDAPVPSLPHVPLSSTASTEMTVGDLDWRSANDSVGAFSRGHIDVLRWEAENPPPAAASSPRDGSPLSPAEAVRIALTTRPGSFATADMSSQERAQADIAVVELARDVHRAWIKAVAAEQSLRLAQDVFEASEAGAELGVRMTRAGNWGQDRLIPEQLALSEAGIRLAQAKQGAIGAREALIRLLGLWGDAIAFTLPQELPKLPGAPMSDVELEATALRQHPLLPVVAVEAERARRAVTPRMLDTWTDAAAGALTGMDPATSTDNPLERLIPSAPVVDLRRMPGGHETLRAARTQANAAELAVKIRSHVREAYHQYRTAHDIAQATRDDVVRLRSALHEETLLRYNGMLASTWDLLASARDHVASVDAALAAQRDFWLAHTNLLAVLAGAEYPGPDAISAGGLRTERAGGH